MRRTLLARAARAAPVVACLGGCAALAGIQDGDGVSSGTGPAGDGATPGSPEAAAAIDGAACPSGDALESPSVLHAQRVLPGAPVKIDGDAAEWKCVDRLAFTTGQRIVGLVNDRGVATIGMQWDAQHLYLVANVTTSSPSPAAGRLQNFQNDSLSIFLEDPAPTTTLTALDHQIAIDSMGQVADYAINSRTGLNGIVGAAGGRLDSGGILNFVVEAQIDASILGRAAFALNDRVRIDFQVNDGPDSNMHYRIWYLDPAVCKPIAGCTVAGTSEPYCDPHCSGEVVLR